MTKAESLKLAFKEGFVEAMAVNGVTPDMLEAMALEKPSSAVYDLASSLLGGVKSIAGAGFGALKGVAGIGGKALVGASIGLPLMAGYELAKTDKVEEPDIQALKDQDVISAYESATEELARQRRAQNAQGRRIA